MMAVELTRHDMVPRYGLNYGPGYIGFTRPRPRWDPAALGIAYFTREDGEPLPGLEWFRPIHALVVLDSTHCAEALSLPGPGKVVVTPLARYFDNPDEIIVFRKPWRWTEASGLAVASEAARRVGEDYAEELLLANAFRGSFLGRCLDTLTGGRASRFVGAALDARHKWICSKLSHVAHRDGMGYTRGILAQDPALTSPAGHFGCDECFEPWAQSGRVRLILRVAKRRGISPVGLIENASGRLEWV